MDIDLVYGFAVGFDFITAEESGDCPYLYIYLGICAISFRISKN